MLLHIVFIILGLVGLFIGGNWLVRGASRLARSFGISALVVGLTVVAFGTSTPELLVSISAALSETSGISIGNVIGSNIANIGLILAVTGIIYPVAVQVTLLKREIPILLLITIATAALVHDGSVSRIDGLILIVGLILFNIGMIYFSHRDRINGNHTDEQNDEPLLEASQRLRELMRIMAGLILLVIGARLTVDGATAIARDLGVSELVIGVTLVALGTSLPELATSVIAALKKQSDIAIGNVVGSNIYNLLGILGITALIRPIEIPAANLDEVRVDGGIMIIFTILLLPLVINRVLSRREGVFLLSCYIVFTGYVFLK